MSVRQEYRSTLLHLAVLNSDLEEVRGLLDRGANLEARDEDGLTPLLFAATHNYHYCPALLEMLVDAGANLEARTEDGFTPLIACAAYSEEPDLVRELVDAGANLEARTEDGFTPLIAAAAFSEEPDLVRLLLDAGADAKAMDRKWQRAIDYARQNEHLIGTVAYWQLETATAQPPAHPGIDTVTLRNREALCGSILTAEITVQASYGTLTFTHMQLASISIEDAGRAGKFVLKVGDRVSGVMQNPTIEMTLNTGATITLEKGNIASITFAQED